MSRKIMLEETNLRRHFLEQKMEIVIGDLHIMRLYQLYHRNEARNEVVVSSYVFGPCWRPKNESKFVCTLQTKELRVYHKNTRKYFIRLISAVFSFPSRMALAPWSPW